jgi:hypothetical protein
VIGKHRQISRQSAANGSKCDPLSSEINARGPEPGAAGVPARRPRERTWDHDAIEHHMTLFLSCIHPSRPFPPARRDRDAASATQTYAVLPSSAPYSSPRALSVPDPVSTIDELSVAR